MKKLLFILFISTASAQTPIPINGAGTKIPINGAGTKLPITQVYPLIDGSIVIDDGYYNRWPSVVRYSDGELVVAAAQGGSHTEIGPLMIHRSLNGGGSWTNTQLEISSTPIEGEFITIEKMSTGRLVVFYQVNEDYEEIETAYSDDRGVTWTAGTTLSSFDPTYVTSINNNNMVELASGKLLFPVYSVKEGVSFKVILIESTDGETWTVGTTVADYDGSGYTEEKIGEVSMVVIPDGTESSDATTKILMFSRTETNSFFVYLFSSDGGDTWATSYTEEDPGDFVKHYYYGFSNSDPRPPALIAASDGNVYFVIGRRYATTPVMNMQYTYALWADAFANNHFEWATVVEGFTANAELNGNTTDWGYFDLFEAEGAIWGVYYDVSTETHNPLITTRRCWIKMVKLFDL